MRKDEGQVKHAVKTALACCLASLLAYYFRLGAAQLAPVFVFLLMTVGMPSPRLNWLVTQLGVVASAVVSAIILLVCRDAIFLYLAVTLLWIFTCIQLSNWFPLPATLGAMVSALGLFTFFEGTVGDTLTFYENYALDFLSAGFSVVVVQSLLWPFTTEKVFLKRLAEVYAQLERECRQAALRVRSGESLPPADPAEDWAPFRPLRQLLAPELRRGRDTSNPFAAMILACRSVNLRLWFFNRVIAPQMSAAFPAELRERMASVLDQCAERLHALLLHGEGDFRLPIADFVAARFKRAPQPESELGIENRALNIESEGFLLVHGIPQIVLHLLMENIQGLTEAHNALLARSRGPFGAEWSAVRPFPVGKPLIDVNSVRSGAKLVVILLLLLVEEAFLGFPGSTQVAFFATFFASTGNLGRQNKTDLVGLAGLVAGFAYGLVAAFLTSSQPHLYLLLALVFLGQFLASLAFQGLPRYGVAGLQAGLALPFAYLATTGPEWGMFSTVRVRFAGLVVAGFTAVVVHAYLWPVLPMRQLRASIAAALRATAVSLGQLFAAPRTAWEGAPPSLDETVTRARDLLDDALYLPGPEHANPAYKDILRCLQEMDANLEFIHFLVGLEDEHPLRQDFFQLMGDYPEQARSNLETIAQQLQPSARRAARVQPVRWEPDASGRWANASHGVGFAVNEEIDPLRPAVIAHCLDRIARAVEGISGITDGINRRNIGQ